MAKFPPSMQRLIDLFSQLPTIGPKTAERFVFALLRKRNLLTDLEQALAELGQKVTTCERCGTYSEKSPCYICSNGGRNANLLCVVANTTDLAAVENTGSYTGRYHVLGSTIDPLTEPDSATIKKLTDHIQQDGVQEAILAFNPDVEGEATMLILVKILKPLGVKVSRLARGLPMGSDLIYADEVTLASALEGRKEL